MPKRIQRRRTKGWRMPENCIYVGRPSKWGNPFVVGGWYKIGGNSGFLNAQWLWCRGPGFTQGFTLMETPEQCVIWFRRMLLLRGITKLEDIRGKDLACWCSLDQPCHADVLLELANR